MDVQLLLVAGIVVVAASIPYGPDVPAFLELLALVGLGAHRGGLSWRAPLRSPSSAPWS
ncbi:MAG: hypothetical protein RXQ56_02570 [Thermoproteus sp.]